VAFLNWRFGLTQTTLWRIEVAPFPDLSDVATPTISIITIPITLYGYGMVMMPKKGVPRDVQWAEAWGARARQSPSL
jgi:hypothetical protein